MEPVASEIPIQEGGSALKDLVSGGVGEAIGRVRSEALVRDYAHMERYKKQRGQRYEAWGVVVAGQGEVIGKRHSRAAFVDEREEWKGGSRLVRRYENGAVYASLSVDDYGGLKVEMTKQGGRVDVSTSCDPWQAVNGWEKVLVANTPKIDLFLKRLSDLPSAETTPRVYEVISLDGGTINQRRVTFNVNYGWQGRRGGVDIYKAAAVDYEFIRGGAEGGKADVAYARSGVWESASGIWDIVSRQKAMQYIS